MNKRAKTLGMKATTFNNPHGLPDKANKSSSSDIALLAYEYMQSPEL